MTSGVFICLLTAALGADVLPQGRYVSVPAQSVNVLRVGGPAEERKGFPVGLGGAEPGQVAARGQVVIQSHRQSCFLMYLQQEAKLKGCRNERADVRRELPSGPEQARKQHIEPARAGQHSVRRWELKSNCSVTATPE